MTSRAHPDYPGLVEFPLEDVINDSRLRLLQRHGRLRRRLCHPSGRDEDQLFGCDFTYERPPRREGQGVPGVLAGRRRRPRHRTRLRRPTSLMDTCDDPRGRDERLRLRLSTASWSRPRTAPRGSPSSRAETPPTAAEIEARYDHTDGITLKRIDKGADASDADLEALGVAVDPAASRTEKLAQRAASRAERDTKQAA
jgi:hypothetical protein